MKVTAINGSPRKSWNTAQMVESAIQGCKDMGADVKLFNLYGIDFKGCRSCFACKRLGGKSYGRCGFRDGLTPVLEEIMASDALIIGSPVYFGDVTSDIRALFERLWFAGLAYSSTERAIYPRRIPVKLIFTMNVPEENFNRHLNESTIGAMSNFVGPTELLEAVDTYQFDDYSKYETSMFNAEAKKLRRENEFPKDLKRAYELGKRAILEIKR